MARRPKHYWLMKSEPGAYSIDDLKRDRKTFWDGVRNYQARNTMRDDMKMGDGVLFYHSNAKPTGVAGLAAICREGYPDHTAFDTKDKHFDPKSDPDKPRWIMVDIEFVEKFGSALPLADLRSNPDLEGMPLLRRGQRLSVQPVSREHFQLIARLGRRL